MDDKTERNIDAGQDVSVDLPQPGLDEANILHWADITPSKWQRTREVMWQLPRMLARMGHLDARGPENGPPALVIPGFLSTDRATMELRRALGRAGWRAYGWEMGANRGAQPDTIERIGARLKDLDKGEGVLLIGWSLGGLFARAAAREYPDHVRAVVTLASPFSGDLKTNNNVRRLYERIAGHDVNEPPFDRGIGKPPVPTLAFWSRRDGIVSPASARGTPDESDKSIEIDTRHMGFTTWRPAMSEVMRHIREFLTRSEGANPCADQEGA